MQHTPVTVALITKNRVAHLSECLVSLQDQKLFNSDQLIIVDGSDNGATKRLVSSFGQRIQTPITYIYEPRPSFPIARNHAIRVATKNWVVFIDDDCVAGRSWVETIRQSIRKYPSAAVIAGATYTFYRNNVYSIAVEVNELFWKENNRHQNKFINLEAIDNKNTIYNKIFLQKQNILYDETRQLFNGSSEDCDHGRRIQQVNGRGYYNHSLIVHHKDVRSFSAYFHRLYMRSGGHVGYEMRWAPSQKVPRPNLFGKAKFLRVYFIKNHQSLLFIIRVVVILEITSLFLRVVKPVVRVYYRLNSKIL